MDVNKLPIWACVVLVVAALIGAWLLLGMQFGQTTIKIGLGW